MRWGDMIISAGMAGLAVTFYGLATFTQSINPVDPGPAFYPRIVSVLLFLAASGQVLCTWWESRGRSVDRNHSPGLWSAATCRYTFGTLILSVVYVGLFDTVPYPVGAAAFLFVLMLLGGVRRWSVLGGASVGYALVTYYIFGQVLLVPLP